MQLKTENAGRFVSSGRGRHVSRIIASWELIFVQKSQLTMFIGDEEHTARAGDCLLLPPGIRHGGKEVYSPSLCFFWIHFRPGSRKDEKKLLALPRCFSVVNTARLSEYFRIFLASQEETPDDQTGFDIQMQLIFHEAFRQNQPTKDLSRLPHLVDRLRQIITLRFREPLSTSILAEELKCNPDYLGRLWKRYFHESITDTLNKIRVHHAAELLRNSTLNIAEIAYEVGFNNTVYFRQRFFQEYSVSPSKFRKFRAREHVNTE